MTKQILNTYRVYFSGVRMATETTVIAASCREAAATIASRYGLAYNIIAHLKTA